MNLFSIANLLIFYLQNRQSFRIWFWIQILCVENTIEEFRIYFKKTYIIRVVKRVIKDKKKNKFSMNIFWQSFVWVFAGFINSSQYFFIVMFNFSNIYSFSWTYLAKFAYSSKKRRKKFDFTFWTLIQIIGQRESFLINIFYTENYL